jgi:hypothetical protein
MMADGWQPYSLKIGDTYYSYRRLDRLASTIGTAADLIDFQSHMTPGQQRTAGALLVSSLIRNLDDKTWLSGVTDMTNALTDPQRYGSTFINNMAGNVAVPAIVAQAAQAFDPILREARNPLDKIMSRVPGLSQGLAPRRNIFGRPIVNEEGAAESF